MKHNLKAWHTTSTEQQAHNAFRIFFMPLLVGQANRFQLRANQNQNLWVKSFGFISLIWLITFIKWKTHRVALGPGLPSHPMFKGHIPSPPSKYASNNSLRYFCLIDVGYFWKITIHKGRHNHVVIILLFLIF